MFLFSSHFILKPLFYLLYVSLLSILPYKYVFTSNERISNFHWKRTFLNLVYSKHYTETKTEQFKRTYVCATISIKRTPHVSDRYL